MLKVLINEEEVVSNQNLTIDKQMLNTPSVILKNVCPKTWRDNNDYTTNFYHPQDYSKCKILDVTDIPAEPGSTIEGTSFTIPNNDNNKLHELTTLKGNTSQASTPTPDNPVPVNVVSGGQEIEVAGLNLLNNVAITQEVNGITFTINEDKSITMSGTASADAYLYLLGNTTNTMTLQPGTYTRIGSSDGNNITGVYLQYRKNNVGGAEIFGVANVGIKTITLTETTNVVARLRVLNGTQISTPITIYPMIVTGTYTSETMPTYEAYKGQSYEINLGKNLLRNDLSILQANNIGGTWTDNKYVLNGVEFTCNDNGSVSAKRIESSSSNAIFYISRNSPYEITTLQAGTYYLTSHETTGSNSTWKMQFNAGSNINVWGSGNNKEGILTLTESKNTLATIIVYSGYDPNGATFYPMISKSQGTDYAPYKTPIELCKINDYKDFIRKGTGKNLYNGTSTHKYVSNNGTTTNGDNKYLGFDDKVEVKPNTTYTIKFYNVNSNFTCWRATYDSNGNFIERLSISSSNGIATFTTGSNVYYVFCYLYDGNASFTTIGTPIQLELGSQATLYEPYGYKDKWYLYKTIGKVVLNGSENWITWNDASAGNTRLFGTSDYNSLSNINYGKLYSNYFESYNDTIWVLDEEKITYSTQATQRLRLRTNKTIANTSGALKTWLSTHNTIVYYVLATPTTTEITDSELISQLEGIELLEGLNNVSVSSGDLSGIITIHYNYVNASHTEDLLFCGVVKNSGNISLNPREPHYSTLQILDFKTFLSEGELDSFVIYQKTITEAIQMVIANIQDYGFVLGNIKILTPDDIIGAYSTKDKSAFDVFNYIADITQSRWTTRMIDENHVAIDFYDPTLMDEGTEIDYTQTFFENNKIDNMTYSYGSNNYRNKQVMTSSQVYSNISQTQSIIANGYQTQFNTEQPIGKINSITSNGIPLTFATFQEKDMGYVADFYYQPGENYFESRDLRTTGEILIIDYVSIITGRQVITNPSEINRINESTNRKGIVSRYEQRNDATTSMELQKIGETYIKYKGTPEIKLKISTRKNIWEVGERVKFNAPITELDTEYMVRTKKINYIASTDTIFYDYELISSFNSETEINYFDNQRSKTNGNIGEGEYISRNIDIESTANIIFYDTASTEVQVDGDNILECSLNSPFTN